jgi:hypothetical protein
MEWIIISLMIIIIILSLVFIKKIIFSVISIFLIFGLILGVSAAAVYFDLEELSSKSNLEFNILYEKNNKILNGVLLTYEKNKTPDLKNLKVLTEKEISNLKVKGDYEFKIILNREFFERTIKNDTFILNKAFGLNLEKEIILNILEKEEPFKIPSIVLKSILHLGTGRDFLFLFLLKESFTDPTNTFKIIESYQNEELLVEPSRFSFTIIKYLPIDLINYFLPKEN